jgi:outer membrane immunogenic protein
MTRQQSLVALASFFSVVTTSTWAVEPLHSFPQFTGPYIGAAVGYGRQKVNVDNETLGTSFSREEGGAVVGGYAGYNWQFCGPYLLGMEADFNYLNASSTAFDIETGPTGLNETTSLRSRMDWFGTLRVRAGYLIHEDFLLYATGGLAYARVDHTLHDNCVGCGNSTSNLGPFSQSNNNTKTGWTAGGGGEFAFDPHWLLRGEALYVDLGSDTHRYVVVTPAATGISVAKWNDQFWVARVGLAYQFDTP